MPIVVRGVDFGDFIGWQKTNAAEFRNNN
jgi:hypothetical protein